MFTDRLCKHTLINKILQVLKIELRKATKVLAVDLPTKLGLLQQCMASLSPEFCVSVCPFGEHCQNSQKLVKIVKKKKIDNDFALVFKNWLQCTESREVWWKCVNVSFKQT